LTSLKKIDDSYKTIADSSIAELKEKGSRFIAQAFPVGDRAEAEEIVENVSKKYFDATHNCFAYQIGIGQELISRFNDDGEPSGTAGKPILQAISTRNLTNVIIVVTRYFGGTKLGTGGLVRAYGGAASLALEKAQIVTRYLTSEIKLKYPYEFSNLVARALDHFKGQIVSSDYSQDVVQKIQIRKSLIDEFCNYLTEHSSDRIRIIT